MKNNTKKILCFDLDNTICNTPSKNYKKSKPKKRIINLINKLYNSGYIIKIFTSRFMGRNKENKIKAKKQGYIFTRNQVNSWGLKYHSLILGKPSYDIFVDDKNDSFKKNWYKSFISRNKIDL